MQSNRIATIPETFLSGIKTRQNFLLRIWQNPFLCDCEIQWIARLRRCVWEHRGDGCVDAPQSRRFGNTAASGFSGADHGSTRQGRTAAVQHLQLKGERTDDWRVKTPKTSRGRRGQQLYRNGRHSRRFTFKLQEGQSPSCAQQGRKGCIVTTHDGWLEAKKF
ncbi:Hypp1069 [Branchiostoma lanceolatum]|uniref:Hypp1069 protein n=1 Tax=Branchiostoma lanceolatum TaxID=7740 RepID=A0A8J9ZGT9_BRALA|nr:Hypp1069 [Branchiostoma lanceolatum]